MLMTQIHEAERTTHSAELISSAMKDAVIEMPIADHLSTSDVMMISKQKDMLLKELETFRNLKRTIEQLLKSTVCSKASSMEEIFQYINVLLDMVLEDELENAKLKKQLEEKERHLQELSLLLQSEKASTVTASRLSRSLEETQVHLQNQIEKKEADNKNLIAKIKSLKESMCEQRLQVKELKQKIEAVKKKSAHEKEALKKAIKVLKKRAQHFEAAKENVILQIGEKDDKLCEVHSVINVWKRHHEVAVEERTSLEIHVENLTQKITDILTSMQKIKEHATKSKEELVGKLEVGSSGNELIIQENERLTDSIGKMEEDICSFGRECNELQEKLKQEKSFVEKYKTQVDKIQTETENLKYRFEKVMEEKKLISENKDSETEKVDTNSSFVENRSLEMENSRIQRKLVELNQKVEKMITQNRDLKGNLADQEQILRNSAFQLDEKSKECSALLRLLETAVEDGRKQVSAEIEKTTSSEKAIEKRILDLETELRKKKEEKKKIACTLSITEKHNELRLKALKYSLEQTESKNQNIQNYVQLLKASYATMFG